MIDILIIIVVICALIVASFTDIKTREVPDWLNFSLVAMGLGFRLIYSILQWDYTYILDGVVGFIVFLGLAYLMFYTGQWGGGDSKLMMGLGALIGLKLSLAEFPFLISFLLNLLIIGAVYGLLWSLFLAISRSDDFVREFKRLIGKENVKKARLIMLSIGVLVIVVGLIVPGDIFKILGFFLGLLIIMTFYLWVFIKAIETSCMIKLVKPQELTEGDWIVKDVVYRGKRICGPKDLGIEKKQIETLVDLYKKKKIKKILIKEGIPFVPSFLLSYLITLFLGNIIFLFI